MRDRSWGSLRPRLGVFIARSVAARRLDVQVDGLEHLPRGRALLVANHSFGWDVVFAIHNQLGRPVWALGEHLWWKLPYLRQPAAAVGTVDGTRENLDRLLERDALVLVQSGGLREALKPRELRYRLLCGKRHGFVRAAIANQAPLLPLAAVGGDQLFSLLGNAYERAQRWLQRRGLPVPLPSRIFADPAFRALVLRARRADSAALSGEPGRQPSRATSAPP